MITIKNFGIAREILQNKELLLDPTALNIRNIGDLRSYLFEHYDRLARVSSVAFAVNEEYAQDDIELQDGDTVAIIPPVSGG